MLPLSTSCAVLRYTLNVVQHRVVMMPGVIKKKTHSKTRDQPSSRFCSIWVVDVCS